MNTCYFLTVGISKHAKTRFRNQGAATGTVWRNKRRGDNKVSTIRDDKRATRGRTSSGKQRELVQRDQFFLKLAEKIVFEEGFHALTISRLAEESGFTRGTFYQRFCSKEGILLELWLLCLAELGGLMSAAVEIEGTTRERATAVAEAFICYFRRHPENLRLLGVVGADDTKQALSDDQQARLARADAQMMGIFFPLAEEAVESGEMVLPEGARLKTLGLILWAMFYGVTDVMRGNLPIEMLKVTDPLEEFLSGLQRLFDGYGWHPLTNEHDYDETRRQVRAVLFPHESQH
jgi:AcrR family transcriptional regulator